MKNEAKNIGPDLGKLSLPDLGTVVKLRAHAVERDLNNRVGAAGPRVQFHPSLIKTFDIEPLGQMARAITEHRDALASLGSGVRIMISGGNYTAGFYDGSTENYTFVKFKVTGTGPSGEVINDFEKEFSNETFRCKNLLPKFNETLQSIINIAQFL